MLNSVAPRRNAPAKGIARARKEEKRMEAEIRQKIASERTPQQQLAVLDRKLGKGVGAVKERAKLHKLIENMDN